MTESGPNQPQSPRNTSSGESSSADSALPTNEELHRLVQKLNSIDFDNLKFNVDQPAKGFFDFSSITCWDLINLLLIPAFLTGIAFTFQKCSDETNSLLAEQQRQQDLAIAKNSREVQYLNAYIDSISQLLLEEHHEIVNEGDETGSGTITQKRKIEQLIKAESLTILRNINDDRKGLVVRMLHEQGLLTDNATDYKITLSGANLLSVNLESAWIPEIDLSGAFLSKGQLQSSDLTRANLKGTDFSQANLFQANLSQADLTEANLSQANLSQADLTEAILAQADLRGANLIQANLQGTNLAEAVLEDSYYASADTSKDVCFSLLPKNQRKEILEKVIDLQAIDETNNNWLLHTAVANSREFSDIEKLANELDQSLLYCSTQFPDDFDPEQNGMKLIRSLEDYIKTP